MNYQDTELFIDNQRIYHYYRNRLISMALSQFIWDFGDITTCDRLFFEKKLLFEGKAALLQPIGTDMWLSLGYVSDGQLDVYGYPTKIRGVGYNSANIETENWLMLYDNVTRQSLMEGIDLYAGLLWEQHMTYRANLKHQNKPYIVSGTKNQELSFRNFFTRLVGFQPYFMVKRKEDLDAISVFKTDVPYNGKELLECLKVLWAEAITMLGIAPSDGIDKKERLITDEVAFDKEEYIIARNARELTRKEFCNKFNKMFDKNISVHMATIDTQLPMDMAQEELAGTSNQDTNAEPGEEGKDE